MLNNPTEQQDKEKLISRCKTGDRQALNLLYTHYRPYLLNICKHYAKEDHVAEDLLHDAFIVILTSLDKLRDTDKLEAWMTTIVRNVGYHYWKHLDKEHTALKQMAGESQDMTAGSLMPDYELMQKLVAQLPKGYQQVFRLSVFEGLSHQEISRMLNIAPHTSSSNAPEAHQAVMASHPAIHRHPYCYLEIPAERQSQHGRKYKRGTCTLSTTILVHREGN